MARRHIEFTPPATPARFETWDCATHWCLNRGLDFEQGPPYPVEHEGLYRTIRVFSAGRVLAIVPIIPQ